MKINFESGYQSIKSISVPDLPDFVVLTGLNGSGKTHFLQAILNGRAKVDLVSNDQNTHLFRFYDWITLIPNENSGTDPRTIFNNWKISLKKVEKAVENNQKTLLGTAKNFKLTDYTIDNIHELIEIKYEHILSIIKDEKNAKNILKHIKDVINITAPRSIARSFIQERPDHGIMIQQFSDKLRSDPFASFDFSKCKKHLPLNFTYTDPFKHELRNLFTTYEKLRIDNEYNEFRAKKKAHKVEYITDEEFLNIHGDPPWELLNKIFKKVNIPYEINYPDLYGSDGFDVRITNTLTSNQIKFSELSSGEQILMSLVFVLYYSQDDRQLVNYPKLLLFDEIDAPLHPSMTKTLIKIISDVLVQNFGIKVILTTHSPSTVALSPEESIFVIEGDNDKKIIKVTKDHALNILTTGVPSLSILHENRRQVFVESQYDAQLYENLYIKLKDRLNHELSLHFIQSGMTAKSTGSSGEVKIIVNMLAGKGNPTVYGAIDWDGRNNGNTRIQVLGKGKRYTVENYIFDPLLVASYLIHNKYFPLEDKELKEFGHFVYFPGFPDKKLQKLTDWVFSQIELNIGFSCQESELILCEYINGSKVNIPEWYLKIPGHDIFELLKETFPQLKRYDKEEKLKANILKYVVDDIPTLISVDFLNLFKELQS